MKSEYDLIVVGAGPAGLASAKSAVEHGISVLLVEDHAAIGTPVQCGESLIVTSIEEDLGLQLDPKWVANDKVRSIKLFSPNKKCFELVTPKSLKKPMGVILERKMFEKAVAVKLANMGVDIAVKTPAVGVLKDDGFVTGVRVKHLGKILDIRSKVVIAADGPTSIVAKSAGLKVYDDVKKFASCAQFQMANIDIDPTVAEVYIGKVAPGGGAWILPKEKGFANVGLGVAGDAEKRALDYLREFVDNDPRLKKGSIIEFNAGPVPVGGAIKEMVSDGIMVVGDAARQVNPATGGGMIFGIRAGVIAGRVAAEAVKKGDCSKKMLGKYEKEWRKEFGKKFKRYEAVKNILMNKPEEKLDKLFEDIGRREMPKGVDLRGDFAFQGLRTMLPVLVKHPDLLLELRALFPKLR